jgi:hypothetical protein
MDDQIDPSSSKSGLPPTGLHVGPVDSLAMGPEGRSGPSVLYPAQEVDGRTDEWFETGSSMINDIFLRGSAHDHFADARAIPADYSRYERDRATMCSAATIDRLRPMFAKEYDIETAEKKLWLLQPFYKAMYASRLLAALKHIADCSVNFLTNDGGPTAYDAVAFMGFGHIVAELERSDVIPVVRMKFWDDGVLIDNSVTHKPDDWDHGYWAGTQQVGDGGGQKVKHV